MSDSAERKGCLASIGLGPLASRGEAPKSKSQEVQMGRNLYRQLCESYVALKDGGYAPLNQTVDRLEAEVREKGLSLGRVVQEAARVAGLEVTVEEAENGFEFGVRILGLGTKREQEDYWDVLEDILERAERKEVQLDDHNLHAVADLLNNPYGCL